MEKAHLLLVEDEPFLARVVVDSLEGRGYRVTHASDGRTALSVFKQETFSLCIVDVMLPQIDGFALVKQIRAMDEQIPVLFLTARTATSDVIEGYSSGGNDYLKKPFSLDELFLRIAELLRRTGIAMANEEISIAIGGYSFMPHKQTLQLLGKEPIRLSHRETQLLQLLYEHRNQILARKPVLLSLWGDDNFYHARTMDVFITRLRKHLKDDPTVEIINLRGVGFKLLC